MRARLIPVAIMTARSFTRAGAFEPLAAQFARLVYRRGLRELVLVAIALGASPPVLAQEPLEGPRVGISLNLTASAVEERISEDEFRVDAFYEQNRDRASRGPCGFPALDIELCVRVTVPDSDPSQGPFQAVAIVGRPVAMLPHRAFIGAPSAIPYLSWSLEEDAVEGIEQRLQWLELLHTPFDCDDFQCKVIMPRTQVQDTPGEDVLLLCSTSVLGDVERIDAPPQECEPVAVMTEDRNCVRTYAGWGTNALAAEIGFRPAAPIALGGVVFDGLVQHAPQISQADFVEALERGFSSTPLDLETVLFPVPGPTVVTGTATPRVSLVIRPQIREWVTSVALTGREDRGLYVDSRFRITLTLLVNHLATPLEEYYLANPTQRSSFERELVRVVREALGGVCGREWPTGNLLDCRR